MKKYKLAMSEPEMSKEGKTRKWKRQRIQQRIRKMKVIGSRAGKNKMFFLCACSALHCPLCNISGLKINYYCMITVRLISRPVSFDSAVRLSDYQIIRLQRTH